MSTAEEKLRRCIFVIEETDPLFGYVVASLRWEPTTNPNLLAMSVDGRVLRYQPKWVEEHDVLDVFACLKHELGHVMLGHPARCLDLISSGKGSFDQNMLYAADLAVNDLLRRDTDFAKSTIRGIACMPGEGSFAELESGKSFEEYYELLVAKAEREKQNQQNQQDEVGGGTRGDSEPQDSDEDSGNSGDDDDSDEDADDDDSDDAGDEDADEDGADGNTEESSGDDSDDGSSESADSDEDATEQDGDGDDENGEDSDSEGGGETPDDSDGSQSDDDSTASGAADDSWADGAGAGEIETDQATGCDLELPSGDPATEMQEAALLAIAATDHAKQTGQGRFGAGLEKLLSRVTTPEQPDWRLVLSNLLRKTARIKPSWHRKSRRYHGSDFLLPGKGGKTLRRIGMIIDTSGSLTNTELFAITTSIKTIYGMFQNSMIELVECDAQVQRHRVLPLAAIQSIDKVAGGGGTDLRPAFAVFDEKCQCDLLICATDGYWTERINFTKCPLIWLLTGIDRKFECGTTVPLRPKTIS